MSDWKNTLSALGGVGNLTADTTDINTQLNNINNAVDQVKKSGAINFDNNQIQMNYLNQKYLSSFGNYMIGPIHRLYLVL